MAKRVTINFDQSTHKSADAYSANVRLVNCYSMPDPGGRSAFTLMPMPGSTSEYTLSPTSGTGCRGQFKASTGPTLEGGLPTVYSVFGNSVYRIKRDGSNVLVGTFNSSAISGTCTFAENQGQTSKDAYIYVCDRQAVYKFNAKADDAAVASTFTSISMPHRPDGYSKVIPSFIGWSEYRLILSAKDCNAFFYSDTGTDTFNDLNTYFGESSPDKLLRVQPFGGNLWAFGTYSYDIFSRTGNVNNPYVSPKSASGRIGLASAESLAVLDDVMLWLGRGGVASNGVYMATKGGQVTRVSDMGIEELLKSWQYSDYAYGTCFTLRGQRMYALTSVSDRRTFIYNIDTGKWHQASSSNDGTESYWDVMHTISGYGPTDILFGSRSENVIAKFDDTTGVDYLGRPITRVWQSPVIISGLNRFRIKEIVVDVDTGTSSSYTEEAKAWIQLSHDGKSFNERVTRSLGTKGQYARKVGIKGGGMPRDLVIRLGTSDPAPIKAYSIRMDYEECAR